MGYLPNANQMKEADSYTIHTLNVPSLELMERAALGCVRYMEEARLDFSKVCIVCGSGNNGGDGFAIARLLFSQGLDVEVAFIGNKDYLTEETKYQMEQAEALSISIEDGFEDKGYSLIIDAIFGVGLSREVSGSYRDVIVDINKACGTKVAIDIASGISADTGQVLGVAFQADMTVAIQRPKLGQYLDPGRGYTGELFVADIGISSLPFENDMAVAQCLDARDYKKLMPKRNEASHKGSFGKVLVIAGNDGMAGAAFFNAKAAYRTGAGLVQVYTPRCNRAILQIQIPEAIIQCYETYNKEELSELLAWSDVVCIGSGIGTGDVSFAILKQVIEEVTVPCVIDADGINLLAKHSQVLEKLKADTFIFTPHLKEMGRLLELSVSQLTKDRVNLLTDFTDKYPVTVVLKDARTTIWKKSERMVVNTSGNAAMAKGGSGDVLTGMLTGLLAQGCSLYEAAVLGDYLHGRAGDYAREELGSYSVLASDLIEHIADAMKEQEGM